MTAIQDELKSLTESLKQQRDEINVQLHLAKQDIKDEWVNLEKNWEHFLGKVNSISKEAEEARKDIASAAHELGHQIKASYEKIKRQI